MMNNFINIKALILLWVCCLGTLGAQGVIEKKQFPGYGIGNIAFSDSRHGMITASRGTVFITSDGGTTWNPKAVTYPGVLLGELSMPDSNTTFLFSNKSHLYRTTDGGLTWDSLGNPAQTSLFTLSFFNSQKGIISADGKLLRTTNGGVNWIQDSLPNYVIVHKIEYLDSLHVVAVGTPGVVMISNDGGSTWLHRSFPSNASLVAVCSFNKDTITVGSSYPAVGQYTWMTTNGGMTWLETPCSLGVGKFYRYGSLVLSVAGYNDILISRNKGKTWTQLLYLSQVLSSGQLNEFTVSPSGGVFVIAYDQSHTKTLISMQNVSTPRYELTSPDDGTQRLVLEQNPNRPYSARVSWFVPTTFLRTYSLAQISTDSLFASPDVQQQAVLTNDDMNNTYSTSFTNLSAATRYYWRVAVEYLDGTHSQWSVPRSFTTAGGVIEGIVYDDEDKDGIRSPGERGVRNVPITSTGKAVMGNITDAQGRFAFIGLDSGSYVIQGSALGEWIATTNTQTSVQLSYDAHVSGLEYGRYYPWNSVSGAVFHDMNENGVQDYDEPGLQDWIVRLRSVDVDTTMMTDMYGLYVYDRLFNEPCSVMVVPSASWEKITPRLVQGYDLQFYRVDQHFSNVVFGVHQIPSRVKVPMVYHDVTGIRRQTISFGVRPGASLGIWGNDAHTTTVDFSEGEAELPAPLPESFDARFISPPGVSAWFGEGSWVDMRLYGSSAQTDTYRVAFRGHYPVTFHWDKEAMNSLYSGSVVFQYSGGLVDMTLSDSIVISDSLIQRATIIASGPVLAPVGVFEGDVPVPERTMLFQNYPNPFNPVTIISYSLDVKSNVRITVYDVLGREVVTLIDEEQQAGYKTILWDAKEQPSGIYLYKLTTDTYSETKKLLLLR